MRTSKKILGVVMALMMLMNIVALVAYAMPADTVCELTIVADKASYAAGDEIVLTIYGQSNSETTLEMAGQYILGYDSAGIEPYSTGLELADHGFVAGAKHTSGYDASGSQVVLDDVLVAGGMTTVSNGDKVIGYFIAEQSDTFDADSQTGPVELFSVKMKVRADAPDGDYEIAFNEDSFADYNCYVVDETAFGLYGLSGPDFGFTATNMFAFGAPVVIHVGAAGPAVTYSKTQVKMNLNSAKTALEGDDPIRLRVTSTISASDFATYFANTSEHDTVYAAGTTDAITSVGIVAYKGTAASFDEATAKALVTDGTAAANYAAAETDYISNAGGVYSFGAIIKGSRADAFASDVTFLGFVRYFDSTGVEQVIFYDTAVTKTVTDQTVADYIAAVNA